MNKIVLVIAAHTDDEALGCGGTIARHVAEGDKVYAVFIADGVTSRLKADQNDLISRNSAAEQARKVLGIHESYYLGLPDNRLDSIPLIVVIQSIEPIISRLQPNIIYTHHSGDLNIDHQITHQAVMTACRPMPGSGLLEIYAFEVVSSTEWATPGHNPFIPNVFIDISSYIETKQSALACYQTEMRIEPHTRSLKNIEYLARHRGHCVGMYAAEAFMMIRMLK